MPQIRLFVLALLFLSASNSYRFEGMKIEDGWLSRLSPGGLLNQFASGDSFSFQLRNIFVFSFQNLNHPILQEASSSFSRVSVHMHSRS